MIRLWRGLLAASGVPLIILSVSGHLLAQPALKITSPEKGTVVYSGDVLEVTVEASDANEFRAVTIIWPLGMADALPSPPYRFNVKIPPRAEPRRYTLFPDGITKTEVEATSGSGEIQVEHSGTPLSLTPGFGVLVLQEIGDEVPVGVTGKFADAERVDLDESSFVRFVSDNTSVVTANSEGHAKAVGVGSAKITIRYKGVSAVVPVTVGKPSPRRR